MTDSPHNHLAKISVLFSIAVPVSLFAALWWLRPQEFVQNASGVACQAQEDCDKQWAELARAKSAFTQAQSGLMRHAHVEMIALTLLAVALLLLCFLLTRRDNPKWAKHVLITSVVVSLAACLLRW